MDYATLAQRLSKISGHQISPSVLQSFEQPRGKAHKQVRVTPNFRGFSGNFSKTKGYDATFRLDVQPDPLEVQRAYYDNLRSPRQVIQEALEAILLLHENPHRGMYAAGVWLDYNVV